MKGASCIKNMKSLNNIHVYMEKEQTNKCFNKTSIAVYKLKLYFIIYLNLQIKYVIYVCNKTQNENNCFVQEDFYSEKLNTTLD